ncbi:MAG: phosphoribosylformylglycinamidine synthase subunit PurL [Candidatus Delongbacteria bacterium]|nr:phosphoribosylformylglycinamidine synthase subunit PurL [Candidatus Delongbacteria bacterium]
MQEPVVDLALVREHGLLEDEYEQIRQILGRNPNYTELGMYSVLWSEHCSYKNSIAQLKTLPRSGGRMLVEAGEENAGLIDIGEGLAVAFKIESHNHPSAVEPYQGAATGVGGIMRDIFTMGARPICSLNSLRFGSPDDPHNRFLLDGVVAGIADYGNCLGIPTVGGEVAFDDCYSGNPLINAMSVGIVDKKHIASATAAGIGNPIFIIGSSTGRDGIHGATFASVELTAQSQERKSSVQVGDPFMEKLLLEASLDLTREHLISGIQDMGAAGITCSACEMSAKSRTGMRIDLDLVPQREDNMSAYEILLSESQERMLVVGLREKHEEIIAVLKKWDIPWAEIGVVTDNGRVQVYEGEVLKADVPAVSLVLGGGAPVYHRESREPDYYRKLQVVDACAFPEPADIESLFLKVLASPNIVSRRYVYEQYDHMIGAATVIRPGGDAAVVRILPTGKYLAVTTDCTSRFLKLDPREGARQAVSEAARNIAVTGARPLAITNCLNFGDPYDPEIYWQFKEVIAGMGEACRCFDTPVTGGNVSFYNETPQSAVHPTPVIGMIGLIEDSDAITPSFFRRAGDRILLAGTIRPEIAGGEYQRLIQGKLTGKPPEVNLAYELNLQRFLLAVTGEKLLSSAHDVADGGVAVALTEACIGDPAAPLGCRVELPFQLRPDLLLFSESQGVVVMSAQPTAVKRITALAAEYDIPLADIGEVTTRGLQIGSMIDLPLEQLSDIYHNTLARILHPEV